MPALARAALLALAALVTAVPLGAQMPTEPPGKADPALVVAGSYHADPHHTLVGWKLNHLGFSDYFGLFGDVTGTLSLDPAHLDRAKVSMSIPISHIVTANPALTSHLLKPAPEGGKADFFGADPAPATFVSTSVTPGTDGRTATIVGNLTLNGMTHPVTIAARFVGAGTNFMTKKPAVGFSGTTTIKRSEFGVGYGVPLVSDEVKLDIAAAFDMD